VRTAVFLVLIGLYLTSVVIEAGWVAPVISVVTLVAVLTSWRDAGRVGRAMATVSMLAGGAMLLLSGHGVASLALGFGEMVYIVTPFFAVANVVHTHSAFPVRSGGQFVFPGSFCQCQQSVLRHTVHQLFSRILP
jgi:hypothetical protein